MTEIDRAQLAALDASGMHNTGRMAFEYGEFDTVKGARSEATGPDCLFVYDGLNDHYRCHRCHEVQNASDWHKAKGACLYTEAKRELNKEMFRILDNYKAAADEERSLIQQRSETHGDFTVNSQVSQAIKRAIRTPKKYMELHDFQKEALDAVAGKIGRIIAGDADYDDHWADIAGYAELVRERLKK